MTGKDFNVMRIKHKKLTDLSIEEVNEESSKSSYIIADVGGHFINITGITSDGKLEYFDPYIRKEPKDYAMEDIKGAYFVMEKTSYKQMEEQNEKK